MSTSGQRLSLGLDDLPAPDAQRVRLFRLLLATAGVLRTRMDRRLASDGLTTQQAMLLHHLEASAGPPTISEVAAWMAVSHQNIKQIALALARKGFLEILTDERDARVRRLRPARKLRQMWRRRDPADFAAVADWTAMLDDREIDALVDALARLYATRDQGPDDESTCAR
jgi:DNA-binding MarR family transcriptional regulator